jgi:site-specific DNA-cytosine methylase
MDSWLHHVLDKVPRGVRPVKVLSPCAGVKTHHLAAKAMGMPYETAGDFETNIALRSYLHFLAGQFSPRVNCSTVSGDVTSVPIAALPLDVDAIISGPPCPPFTSIGQNLGELDLRSAVYITVMHWIVHLAKHGTLSFFILENVVGMMTKRKTSGTETSFLDWAAQQLRIELPAGWEVAHRVCNAHDCQSPQSRRRVFLYGTAPSLRSTSFQRRVLKADLPDLPPVDIGLFLEEMSNDDYKGLTPRQQVNVLTQHAAYIEKLESLGKHDFGFVDIGRDPTRHVDVNVAVGYVRTLRCKTTELWLFAPPALEHKFGRLGRRVTPLEKAGFANIKYELLSHLSNSELERAVGNCIPVPLIGSVLLPLYRAWADSLKRD